MKISEVAKLQNSNQLPNLSNFPRFDSFSDIMDYSDPLKLMAPIWQLTTPDLTELFGNPRKSPLFLYNDHLLPKDGNILSYFTEITHPGRSGLLQFALLFPCFSSFVTFFTANEEKWATEQDCINTLQDWVRYHPTFKYDGNTVSKGLLNPTSKTSKDPVPSMLGKLLSLLTGEEYIQAGIVANRYGIRTGNIINSFLNSDKNVDSKGLIFGASPESLLRKVENSSGILPKPQTQKAGPVSKDALLAALEKLTPDKYSYVPYNSRGVGPSIVHSNRDQGIALNPVNPDEEEWWK